MTVNELIQELQLCPRDLSVMAAGELATKVIIEECSGNKYVRIFDSWNLKLVSRYTRDTADDPHDWIEREKTTGYTKWLCPNCRSTFKSSQRPWYKFCPNCGICIGGGR